MRVPTEVGVCMKQNTADCDSAWPSRFVNITWNVGLPTTDSKRRPNFAW